MSRQKTLNELFCTTSRGSQNSVVSEGASKGGSSSGTSGGGSENPPCFNHACSHAWYTSLLSDSLFNHACNPK